MNKDKWIKLERLPGELMMFFGPIIYIMYVRTGKLKIGNLEYICLWLIFTRLFELLIKLVKKYKKEVKNG